MPMYEYRCQECGEAFERLRRMAEADQPTPCPVCESGNVQLQVSGFATAGCGAGGGGGRFT